MTSKRHVQRGGRRGATIAVDPEQFFGDSRRRVIGRKTQQLCSQAQRAISYSLSCDFEDEMIRDLYVLDVQPHPDGSRLLITIGNWEIHGGEEVLRRLKTVSGTVRASVARAINRKKAPTLAFTLGVGEVDHDR